MTTTTRERFEELKDIPGFEGLYAMNSSGDVWSYAKGKRASRHDGKWIAKVKIKSGKYSYIRIFLAKDKHIYNLSHNKIFNSLYGKL